MFKVDATFKPDPAFQQAYDAAKTQALEMTGEAIRSDLILSQTMPFDTGDLQNLLTFVDYEQAAKGLVAVVSQGPYARRLYFHPEYNFQRGKNPFAGGRWLDPYLEGGAKASLPKDAFTQVIGKLLK